MRRSRCLVLTMTAALLATAPVARAELRQEELTVEKLATALQPRWVWVNDISFDRMADGRAYLIDADKGQMLGMVSGGYSHGSLMLSPDGTGFGMPAVFMERGSRGKRTDVVTFYRTTDLTPGKEIEIPAKRYSGLPFLSTSPVTTDGRFGLIYNFTPEQSVSVVDMQAQTFVGETATPGCGLIFPTGPRRFFMMCADGAIQPASLDDKGVVTLGTATPQLFPDEEPVTEKGVWTGSEWLFFTASGKVHVIKDGPDGPAIRRTWPLLGPGDDGWRPGALQTAAYHRPSARLYVLMHKGGPFTHKDPGTEVWVYDTKSGKRTSRIALTGPAMAVGVSGDTAPLLYTTMFGETSLKIYDAGSGKLLRQVGSLGPTMTVIQPAPVVSP